MVQPYVGVGAGYQWAQESNLHVSPARLSSRAAATDTEGKFAYQAILGAALPIAAAAWTARLPPTTASWVWSVTATTAALNTDGGVRPDDFKLNDDYNHTILVGFRYNFGAACAGPGGSGRGCGAGVAGFAVLPGVLRLGQGDSDRSRSPDRLGSSSELHQGAVHPA